MNPFAKKADFAARIDTALAGFKKIVADLEAIEAEADHQVDALELQIADLTRQKTAHEQAGFRASVAADSIKKLIGDAPAGSITNAQ